MRGHALFKGKRKKEISYRSCYERKYKSKVNTQDAIVLLRRKNIYDIFEYKFKYEDEDYYITLIYPKGNREWGTYKMTFNDVPDNTCIFNVTWCKGLFNAVFYESMLDTSFFQKLEAVPIEN